MIPFLEQHILTLLIFSPLIGIGLIMLIPRRYERAAREVALFSSLLTFAISLICYARFSTRFDWSFGEVIPWVESLNIYYRLGIDGASLLLLVLTTLLTVLAVLCSWHEIQTRRKEFMALVLATEIGMLGAFCALDIFLFYVFWEVMLIPMYFIIGMWGGERKIIAAVKFLLYTMVGSVLMLVAIIYLSIKAGGSFDYGTIANSPVQGAAQLWLFGAFALAFAIKVPIWPLHTWLPDAHTEAPTAGSVLLAGIFLKAGAYGFYRFAFPLFPDAVVELRTVIAVLALIGIVVGALVAMMQPDIKRLIAYSSVSHLGFVVLGLLALNKEGAEGAVLQMINHGLTTGGLFLLVGMIYARRHSRMIADYGGIAKVVPIFTVLFIFMSLASMGLPGLNNFAGEFLVLLGTFHSKPVWGAIAVIGVVLGAVYLLWMIERVFFGKVLIEANSKLKDVGGREVLIMLPLVVLIIWIGLYPRPLLDKISRSADMFVALSSRAIVKTEVKAKGPMIMPGPSIKVFQKPSLEVIVPKDWPSQDGTVEGEPVEVPNIPTEDYRVNE